MKAAWVLAGVVLLAVLPELTGSNYMLGVAVSGLLFLVAAAGLNLVYGFAGSLSFAQLGCWGVGAYVAAIVVMDAGGSFWSGVLAAGVLNGVLALVIGAVILRSRPHAFVVVTLTFALLCGLVSRDWVGVTRGPMGIPGLHAPVAFGFVFGTTARIYEIALVFALVCLGLLYALGSSRIGLTLKAIRQNEVLARSQGVSPLPYKLAAFVIAAVVTGMAGGIFAFHLSVVDPLIFDFYYMQTFLIIVIIRRRGEFLGRGGGWRRHGGVAGGAASFERFAHGGVWRDPGWRDAGNAARGCRVAGGSAGGGAAGARGVSAVLEVRDLRKSFRGVAALGGVSFSVAAGGITGLIGPNGSGKSTAIDCISGFQRADGGQILLGGKDVRGVAPQRIARLGLTRTFQDVRVYERFTLLENLLVSTKPFEGTGWCGALLRGAGYRRAEGVAVGRARALIELVGLTRLIEAPAAVLSYGQKKLLAFAAAMMPEPRLVVLDEPVAGVNPTRINEVAEILRRANRLGTAFLVVEHNVDFIGALCDHVVVFDRGLKLCEGPPEVVHRDPRVLDVYLGIEPVAA